MKYGYGFKFLAPCGATEYKGKPFYYNLPQAGEKWSAPTKHPEPAAPDDNDCGPGRLHVMNGLDAKYAPDNWWPWYARYAISDIIGSSGEKIGVSKLELRRIEKGVFWKTIRLGWCKGANLYRADLYEANLYGADLYRANLYRADLCRADLRGATYDKYTNWPDGFDPIKAGAKGCE